MSAIALTLQYLKDLAIPRALPPVTAGVDLGFAPKRGMQTLALAILALSACGAAVSVSSVVFGTDHLLGLAPLMNLNGEHNVPTWFSSVQLLGAAAVAAMLSLMDRRNRMQWRILIAAFVFLSLDETASLHEQLNRPLRTILGAGGAFYFPWIAVGGLFAATVAAAEIRLLASLPRQTRTLLLVAGGAYLAGALGIEAAAAPLYAAGAQQSAAHAALVVTEETLEMAAIAAFIGALLTYAQAERLSLVVIFDDRRGVVYGNRAQLRLSPRRVTRALMAIVLVLSAVSLLMQAWLYEGGATYLARLVRLVNLSREGNIPTWWQASALAGCAILALVVARAEFASAARFRVHWAVMAIAFGYLSMDEAAGIHELTVRPLRETFNTSGLLYYPWVLIGATVVVIAAVASRAFIGSLPVRTRHLFVAAAIVYVTGALGVESLSGMFAEVHGRANMGYAIFTTIEETLEMLGVVLAARALMEYVRDFVGPVRLGRLSASADLSAPA